MWNLIKHRLVVVDVIDPNDDLCGAAEWIGATGSIVICGGDVEDVLRAPEPGGWAPSQLDDA